MKLFIYFLLAVLSYADIRVAVAGNVAFAIKDLGSVFYKQTHIKIIPIISSSGKLTAQITRKAPYDVFLSANVKYPMYLYTHHIITTPPRVYAQGQLVLFAKNGIHRFDEIFSAKKIAIANPKTAPYGRATREFLQHKHLYHKLQPKLIIAPNISAAFSYAMQITNYGFVARSLLFAYPALNNKEHYILLDSKYYSPIKQAAALISNTPQARKFYNFLFSTAAKEIFKKYGYIVP
ncbi:MAG: molybdate ABC transporter substrate-binding protein [Epsilonproteobacteria bacterium]|nr:molybdate ABC transporter substrate-binding protein [Campylobacterota bacterium]